MAVLEDVDQITRVHVDSWKTTYKGIVSQKFLDDLSYANRASMWKRMIERPSEAQTTIVATVDERVVGFVDVGRTREADLPFKGELMAIYLVLEHQKKGMGRELFQAGIKALKASEITSMMLWVLKDNPTKFFYERMGGRLITSKFIKIGKDNLEELCYGWDQL